MSLKKTIQILSILILVFTLVLSGCTKVPGKLEQKQTTFSQNTFDPKLNIEAKSFASDAEFQSFVKQNQIESGGYNGGILMRTLSSAAPAMAEKAADSSSGSGVSQNSYSQTNNQVASVDEADIIKTDGEYIYTISQNTLFIAKAYPGIESKIVSTIKFNSTPQGIFLKDGKLTVFGNFYDTAYFKKMNFIPRSGMTFFDIYDISDKEKPVLVKDYKFEGNYFQARMTGDYVYFVITSGLEKRTDYPTPLIFDGDVKSSMSAKNIFYYPMPYIYPELVTVHAVNMAATDAAINSKSVVVESASNMYMSEKNIFITNTEYINEWEIRQKITMDFMIDKLSDSDKTLVEKIKNVDNDVLSKSEKDSKIMQVIYESISYMTQDEQDKINEEIDNRTADKMQEYEYMEYTVINKLSVENGIVDVSAQGKVPGHVINQFSLDENNDVLRIATTISQRWLPIYYAKRVATETVASDAKMAASSILPRNDVTESENQVYTLDKNLKILGSLKGLAKGEQIYSTRFIGDRLYMVTFKQVDPFFVIDLSDASNIKELGKLKLLGFSRYLHPYDENTIIGIGRDATDNGRTEGLKISLFDVTDVENPKTLASFVTTEKYAQSTAEWEHKAFLFSKEKNLLVIPAYNYNYDYTGNTKGQEYNGAMVFNITKNGITLRGIIDHSSGSGNNYYGPLVERSLYINELLYTKSSGLLRINKIDDLSSVNKLELVDKTGAIPIV